MIELKNVSKVYPLATGELLALKNVNLQVQPGEIFGVIGTSGAGKSTLIRCVNLLERPTSGEVWVAGKNLTQMANPELRSARRKIGMIFQHFNLLATRTVYQNIALPLELLGYEQSEITKAVTPLLEFTGLIDKQHTYPAQLSGGQKQRVAIARSLVCKPDVLLCDEATSALDPQTTKAILHLLKDINIEFGLTILLITHEMEVIKEIADKVALLEHGAIIEQTDTVKFFSEPQTTTAKDFIKAALKQDLPAVLQEQLKPEPAGNRNAILRIIFHGKAADEPLMAYLMHDLGIKLNILQANIEFLKKTTLGIMVVEIIETNNNFEQSIAYLKTHNASVEIMGYVDRNDVGIA